MSLVSLISNPSKHFTNEFMVSSLIECNMMVISEIFIPNTVRKEDVDADQSLLHAATDKKLSSRCQTALHSAISGVRAGFICSK